MNSGRLRQHAQGLQTDDHLAICKANPREERLIKNKNYSNLCMNTFLSFIEQ